MHELNDEPALMRRYLLGDLDEVQQEQMEERLLCDNDFAERLSAAQDHLIDDYAFDALSEREREQFERNFVLDDARRKKVLFSLALKRHVSQHPAPDTADFHHPPPFTWKNPLPFLAAHKVWVAFSLTSVLLLVFAVPKVVRLLKTGIQPAPSQTQRARIERQVAELNSRPADATNPDPHTLELALQPALLRADGEIKQASLTGNVSVLSLKLGLRRRNYKTYEARVLPEGGEEIFAVSPLTPEAGGTVMRLRIPAEFLPTGDYQIVLNGIDVDGQPQEAGRYYFRTINNPPHQ
ncbi:MAG: hypothetical protein ACJ74J_18435 [Blastocatellia bacterium]